MSDSVTQEFLKHTQELVQAINGIVRLLCQLFTGISNLIGIIECALDDENLLKDELAKLKHLVVKTQTCFSTLFNRVSRMLRYAEADENWIKKIEKSLSNGNSAPFINYIKQFHRYLKQTVQCHQDYLDFFDKASGQYTFLLHISNSEVKLGGSTAISAILAGGIAASATVAMSGAPIPIIVSSGILGGAVSGALADVAVKAQQKRVINGERNIMKEIKRSFSDASDINLGIKERVMTMIRLLDLILGNKVQPLVNTGSSTATQPVPEHPNIDVSLLCDAIKQCGEMDQSIDLSSFSSAFAYLIKNVKEAHQELTSCHS